MHEIFNGEQMLSKSISLVIHQKLGILTDRKIR